MNTIKSKNFLENYKSKISSLLDNQTQNFIQIRKKIKELKKKNKIIICGNGGSSSIASHVAIDICKVLKKEALTFADDNLITCYANDFGYEMWTTEALKTYLNKGDIVILISSSGKSKNIVNAANYTLKQGAFLITLSGFKKNNPLQEKGDINVWIDSTSYNHIEMAHHIFLVSIIDSLSIRL